MPSDTSATLNSHEIKATHPVAALQQLELTMPRSEDDPAGVPNTSSNAAANSGAAANSTLASYSTKFVPKYLRKSSIPQKIAAEFIGTFILVFTGCGSAMVDAKSGGAITHFGVATAFGLVVMILIYSIGHISGAHINPAVTLAFATFRHFPWSQVPAYIGAQLTSAIAAALVLKGMFHPTAAHIGATIPAGSNSQSLALEVLITFILMFVVSAVATDTRAIGELAGLAVGATVALNAIFAGPISGASMNPARSLGPAIASHTYKGIWVYIVGPIAGALLGALSYAIIRLPEVESSKTQPKSSSFRR